MVFADLQEYNPIKLMDLKSNTIKGRRNQYTLNGEWRCKQSITVLFYKLNNSYLFVF